MAYNRNDTGRGRDSSRYDHGGRGERSERGGRNEERGFFERAGDEIASWFGDEDDRHEGRNSRDNEWRDGERMDRGGNDRDRGEWRSSGGERGYGRSRYDEQNERGSRSSGRMSGSDDYRSGSQRGSDRDDGYRPMTGDFGRSEQDRGDGSRTPWGRDDYRRTSYSGSGRDHDPHYSAWRDRHLSELDRDYDEYHRERQQHFENDFGSWREGRQQKRQLLGQAREHMPVVGSDGEPVGKVDCVKGDRIILTKSDSEDGRHHSIPCSMVSTIDDNQVKLDCKAEDAKKKWHDESHERALFERERSGQGGPHMLDRSFSGTYR